MSTATIKTIASETGLSPSTISRALTGKGRVNPETKALIQRVADAQGYRPNLAAQELITGRSRTVGLIVPTITNPFFAALLKGVQARARARGYILLLADSDEDATLEKDLVAEMAPRVEGVIIAVTPGPDAATRLQAYSSRVPIVSVNREVAGISSATADPDGGVRQALEHLRAFGHRRVAYVSGDPASWTNFVRHAAVTKHAALLDIELIDIGPYSTGTDGGGAALEPVLASKATAVIAYNDMMALGLISRLSERGFSCPADLSVVGFDDIPYASISNPPLTTVRSHTERLGRTALDRLVSPATDTDQGGSRVPTDLVVRKSTASPRST